MRFELPSDLIGKLTVTFWTDQSKITGAYLLYWNTGEGSEPGFWHHFADGLITWSLVPAVVQAICLVILLKFKLKSNKVCVTFYFKLIYSPFIFIYT